MVWEIKKHGLLSCMNTRASWTRLTGVSFVNVESERASLDIMSVINNQYTIITSCSKSHSDSQHVWNSIFMTRNVGYTTRNMSKQKQKILNKSSFCWAVKIWKLLPIHALIAFCLSGRNVSISSSTRRHAWGCSNTCLFRCLKRVTKLTRWSDVERDSLARHSLHEDLDGVVIWTLNRTSFVKIKGAGKIAVLVAFVKWVSRIDIRVEMRRCVHHCSSLLTTIKRHKNV